MPVLILANSPAEYLTKYRDSIPELLNDEAEQVINGSLEDSEVLDTWLWVYEMPVIIDGMSYNIETEENGQVWIDTDFPLCAM
jgi:hypothetical protein